MVTLFYVFICLNISLVLFGILCFIFILLLVQIHMYTAYNIQCQICGCGFLSPSHVTLFTSVIVQFATPDWDSIFFYSGR